MELNAVENSYARWAPVYDATFGAITNSGRRRAVKRINEKPGTVLEVGVARGNTVATGALKQRATTPASSPPRAGAQCRWGCHWAEEQGFAPDDFLMLRT